MCTETQSAGDPTSAFRAVDPASYLKVYLESYVYHHYVDITGITNITLLEGTTHGKITTEVDNTGLTFFGYDAEPGYVGKDKAVFTAEYGGKQYKIVVELHVFTWVNEKLPSTCPQPQLIKVNGKPVSGSTGLDTGSITVTVANLPNAAVTDT